ncbi:hypothetical protein ZTR_01650 [Talaromyces verruculosus]|nr:hypothetical protein ZTR_01650 [Talaromyces verruculosus]
MAQEIPKAPSTKDAHGDFPAVYTDNSQPKRETSATTAITMIGILGPSRQQTEIKIVLLERVPKRETSATISRRLSEMTPEGEHAVKNFKRKRSDDDVESDWEGFSRPRYARWIFNENSRYRNELRLSRPEPARPRGVKRLFENLKSDILPKKTYCRNSDEARS